MTIRPSQLALKRGTERHQSISVTYPKFASYKPNEPVPRTALLRSPILMGMHSDKPETASSVALHVFPISPMPVFSFTIGSFGDITTILQLAWQLRAALNGARGASAEVAALVNDIDSFACGLEQVKVVLQHEGAHLQPDIVNGIRHALSTCHDILIAVQRKISSFESRMSKAKGHAVWKHYWAVAAWSILGGKEEVDAMRTRLSDQLGLIQFYLSLSHSHDHDVMHLRATQSDARLDHIYALLQELPSQVTVDMPTFRLFAMASSTYYQPCARTSFKRLKELVTASNKNVNFPELEFGLQKDVYRQKRVLPCPDIAHILYIAAAKLHPADEDFPDSITLRSAWAPADILGVPPRAQASMSGIVEYQQLLKLLLERKHSICGPCNCDGAHCHVRFEGLLQRKAYIKDALLAYSEAGTLLLAPLRMYPDPQFIRCNLLPLLWEIENSEPEDSTDPEDRDLEHTRGAEHDEVEDTGPFNGTAVESEGAEASKTAPEFSYSLEDLVSWLESAPILPNGQELLDFSFVTRNRRYGPQVVVECKNVALQMMSLL
ncbi:hypothetical protein AURDEDRAFT_170271 [Auricularia subglabra TFB-10046 SS5]|nr:hypothetical protein AURDEDRAFT_170271 [Auricularia subglabra TFB-10046 SS5]